MFDRVKRIVYRKTIKSLQSKRNAVLAEKENLHDWKISHYQGLVELSKDKIENAFSDKVANEWRLELADNEDILAFHRKESERLGEELVRIDEELARLGVNPAGETTTFPRRRTQNTEQRRG